MNFDDLNNFDSLDLYVSPIEDAKLKRPSLHGQPLSWSDRKNWCSWQEREEIYPGIKDWYVIPASYATYNVDGVEIGYWVLDIDNHEGDRFEEAIKFLRACHLPPSLTVRTPSGGLHIYYRAIVEDLPAPLVHNNPSGLPIEIKVSTGVVAPNGRDRKIIKDLPVAYFTVTEDNPIAKITSLKREKIRVSRRKVNPDYVLPGPWKLPESSRHDKMLRKAKWLQDDGCPDKKVLEWLKKTRDASPGIRRITDKELYDMVDWSGSALVYKDLNELMEENEEEQKNREKPAPTIKQTPAQLVRSVFPGAEELVGWEGCYAKCLFSAKEEMWRYIIDEIGDTSDDLSDEETTFVVSMCVEDMDELKKAWAKGTVVLQRKYVGYKDCVKLALSLA